MKEYTYEELKEQILAIKTLEELSEKETDLKYKIITSYYHHNINRYQRNFLLYSLSIRLFELFRVIE